MIVISPLCVLIVVFLGAASANEPKEQPLGYKVTTTSQNSATDITFTDHQRRVRPCGQTCNFKLCNFNGKIFKLPLASFTILNAPLTTSFPNICADGVNMGRVLQSGMAKVFTDSGFQDISEWKPKGLKAKFRAEFFTTAKVPYFPYSGISHEKIRRNQWEYLHDRCVILPIEKLEIIDKVTQLPIEKVDVSSDPNSCVAFRTTAPAIQVEVIWDSGDDFDLSIEEPDGNILDHRNKRSATGKINGDNNSAFCNPDLNAGHENIVYFPSTAIQRGIYRVQLNHFNNCFDKATAYRLRVMKNGVLADTRYGMSEISSGAEAVVESISFSYP